MLRDDSNDNDGANNPARRVNQLQQGQQRTPAQAQQQEQVQQTQQPEAQPQTLQQPQQQQGEQQATQAAQPERPAQQPPQPAQLQNSQLRNFSTTTLFRNYPANHVNSTRRNGVLGPANRRENSTRARTGTRGRLQPISIEQTSLYTYVVRLRNDGLGYTPTMEQIQSREVNLERERREIISLLRRYRRRLLVAPCGVGKFSRNLASWTCSVTINEEDEFGEDDDEFDEDLLENLTLQNIRIFDDVVHLYFTCRNRDNDKDDDDNNFSGGFGGRCGDGNMLGRPRWAF